MKRRLAALTLSLIARTCVTALPCSAHAEDPPASASLAPSTTIVVLAVPGDRFARVLVAELESLGFHPILIDPETAPASRGSLESAARAQSAMAAIRAVPSASGVEIWIADRVTGKTVLREIPNERGSPEVDDALALRVVELLRASLLEITLEAPSRGDVPATLEIADKLRVPRPSSETPPAPDPPPALRLSLGAGALISPGGFGATASFTVGLAWMPSAHIGACALASVPLSRASVAADEGSADLSVLLVGGGARFSLASPESAWSPTIDVGFLAASIRSEGTPAPFYFARKSTAVTAAPFVRVGLGYSPTPKLRLRADVLTGILAPGVVIQFSQYGADYAPQEVARWGTPFVLSTAGVDFGWF
jgi:hypothetical protein